MDERELPEEQVEHDELQEPLREPVAATLSQPAEPEADDVETFFPPTDPVITTDEHGDPEVLGGFSDTSMDDAPVAISAVDGQRGDEALAEAIRRELREDALTTGLDVEVEVREGVATISGTVSDLVDAEGAEEVAGRVPEIREVIDRTEIAD